MSPRVLAGAHGGRRLRAPAGRETRPTASRVREAVFDMVGPVAGLRVLDLFAGSGAMGVEALSRGAAHVTFVDRAPAALAAVRANVAAVGGGDRSRILRRDARAALRADAAADRSYDLILIDPPYTAARRVAGELDRLLPPVAAAGATIVFEAPVPEPPDLPALAGRGRVTDRSYGDTAVRLIRLGVES